MRANSSLTLIIGFIVAGSGFVYATCPCPNRTHEAIGQRDSSATMDLCKGTDCEIVFEADLSSPPNITAKISCQDNDKACIASKTTDDAHGECIGDHVQNGSKCDKNGTYTRRRMVNGSCDMGWFNSYKGCNAPVEDLSQQETPDNWAGQPC